MTEQQRRGRKLSEERTEHILGTVLDVLHDVGYDRATQKFARSGDPRADVKAFLKRMAEDLSGKGAQTMLGFLASLRSDPEIADVYRETAVARMHEHLKSLLAAELGDDFPDLDLRASAGPAILMYRAAICGQPI